MMVPYSPEGMSSVSDQITQALLTANSAERVEQAIARAGAKKQRSSA